jgi:hypothetical protein
MTHTCLMTPSPGVGAMYGKILPEREGEIKPKWARADGTLRPCDY